MSTFENKVFRKLNSYLEDDDKSISECKFILSISGGVDSMALFHCLDVLNLNYYTAHFNHNFHDKSNEISMFLDKMVIDSKSKKHFNISLELSGAKNFESVARAKRYFHLENLRRRLDCDFILTAHHLDDQIETLHMRKIQNTHWSNSLGILEKLNKVRRPLLSFSKNNILEFSNKKGIIWKEDPTNKDNSFLRNKTRNVELPKLLSKNSEYANELLHQQLINIKRLERITNKISKTNFNDEKFTFGISLDYLKFSSFDEVGRKLILQKFIKENFDSNYIQYSYGKWNNLFSYLTSAKKRNSIFKFSDKVSFYRADFKIYITSNEALIMNEVCIDEKCDWFDGRFIVSKTQKFKKYADKFQASLPKNLDCKVRQWKTADAYISATSGHTRKVSDLFINNKLNYIQKRIQPIVTDINDTILWIPGLDHASIESVQQFDRYSWESKK
ncbi:MAG: tRNA lysidine(34) synthetase TilS [Candidatus Marinimicrobia bacterium]|nr:tRNA lysidine(34) synthetase TilS [Candidatus Neomarinimicrobiota bacterium]